MKDKEAGLKKVKFYDKLFIMLGVSMVVFYLLLFFVDVMNDDTVEIMFLLPAVLAVGAIGMINFGMLYHEFKSKRWIWLIFTIVLFFFGIAPLVLMSFYWFSMRWEFKKGNGIYK